MFTLAEVKAICPNVTPTNWYGLGLLKTVCCYKPEYGGDHVSFHFLHFVIQDYMAARHIASLPVNMQIKLLNDTFWNIRYLDVWMMYVGITQGKGFAFRHFLSGNYFKLTSTLFSVSAISSKILKDKIKCLHLLHCLAESDHEMLPSIGNIFWGRIIDLSHQSLSLNDIHTLAVLLLRSPNKQWEMINLSHCNIDDKKFGILQTGLNTVTFTVLNIKNNNISDEAADDIASLLSQNTKLQELNLGGNHLKATGIMKIARVLKDISTLKILNIENNNINVAAVGDIATVFSHNSTLQVIGLDKEIIIAGKLI